RAGRLDVRYSAAPSLSQRRNRSTRSEGQAPSHGIVPSARRCAIAWPCATTSVYAHRSNAPRIAFLSVSRNRGLMSASNPSSCGSVVSMLELTPFSFRSLVRRPARPGQRVGRQLLEVLEVAALVADHLAGPVQLQKSSPASGAVVAA